MRIKWLYNEETFTDFWWLWGNVGVAKHFEGVSIWCMEFHWKGSRAWYYNFWRRHDFNGVWETTRLTLRLGKWIVVFGGYPLPKCYKHTKVLEVSRFWKRVPVKFGKDYEQHPSRSMCMN